MADFALKKGDRLPILRAELLDEAGAFNLAGCTVAWNYRNRQSGDFIARTAAVESAISGIVQYPWVSGDTSTVGTYEGEFVVTMSDTKQITFPNDKYLVFDIIDEID